MALTYANLITYAAQIAKCPSWTAQASAFLQNILDQLSQDYDFAIARGTVNFTFNSVAGQAQGPYVLPADYLRANKGDVFYTITGVPYIMIPFLLAEFDACVEQAGLAAYPENYAVDDSAEAKAANNGSPVMYVWPPAGGAYPVTIRYQRQMDVEVTQANMPTSTVIPWFPNSNYLLTALTAELMKLTNDDRQAQFLGQATDLLDKYLKMQGARDVVKQVSLDRRYFGKPFSKLPSTKQIGW